MRKTVRALSLSGLTVLAIMVSSPDRVAAQDETFQHGPDSVRHDGVPRGTVTKGRAGSSREQFVNTGCTCRNSTTNRDPRP